MLPKFLSSTYKQYKEDTDDVATWLAKTAKTYGFTSDQDEEATAPKKKVKSKPPKTRKQIRDAARRVPVAKREHIITIKEFLTLAHFIASHIKRPLKVPLAFLGTVQRAISARKKSNDYFRNVLQDIGDSGGHAHFIGVLEEVLTILRPYSDNDNIPNSSDPRSEKSSEKSPEIQLENNFEHLHIEEAGNESLGGPDANSTGERKESTIYKAEIVKSKSELLFAAFSFFHDINKILGFLREIWHGYQAGEIDLITVSVTSNSAVDMVRRMEEDLADEFPEAQDAVLLISLLFQFQCILLSQEPEPRTGEKDLAPFNIKMYDQAQFILMPTLTILSSFSDNVDPKSIPIYKPGHYGKYDATSDRSKKSDAEKFLEDKIILLEILPDFCFLGKQTKNIPAEDELTRGLRIMVNKKKLSLWVVFAAQMFLDLHHIFRDTIDKPFAQLQHLGGSAIETFEQSIRYRKGLQLVNWPPQNDLAFRENVIRRISEWVMEDGLKAWMKKLLKNVPLPEGEFRLFRQHPLLCGLFAFSIQMQMQQYGVTFVNAWGSALYTAHLYNAVKQEGFCTLDWPDMDLLIDMQTPERIFIGGPPKTVDDYLKRFCLSLGYAAEQYAPNRRAPGPVVSRKGPRGLVEICPVSQSFKSRYCDNAEMHDLSLESVELLLNDRYDSDSAGNQAASRDGEGPESLHPVGEIRTGSETIALRTRNKASKAKIRRRFRKLAKLSPLELLLALRVSIGEETPLLQFDYFAFHRCCWSFLRITQQVLHPKLLEYYEPGYLESENQLPFVVGYIFMTASQSQTASRQLGFSLRSGATVSSKMLKSAGEGMNEFLSNATWRLKFSEQVSKLKCSPLMATSWDWEEVQHDDAE